MSSPFSPDYPTARARFVAAAQAAGATLTALPLDARGPRGEDLTIDIAWLGAPRPRTVLLHSAGLHGVEGYPGGAIQLRALERPPQPPADGAVIFLHALNPYGMAHLRRVNEENVDLNRNFLGPDEVYAGAPEGYTQLDGLLNPRSPPAWDLFTLRAALTVARYGMPMLRQAIAGGQYNFPQGLFFGGSRLQQGPARTLGWLGTHLAGAEHVVAIDVHSGLGRYGEDTLLIEASPGTPLYDRLEAIFGPRVAPWDAERGESYSIRGGYPAALPRLLPDARVDFVTQEFGTYPPIRVVHALREENRLTWHGDPSVDHPARQALRDTFSPPDEGWRQGVLRRGQELLEQGQRIAFG